MEAARQDALNWAARAVASLDVMPDHPIKEMLRDLADYVVARIA
jgi:octaprenyl-diphosphate synthase